VTQLGKTVVEMERDFNLAAGFTSGDDRLPEYFKTEMLPPYDLVFDVSDEELDTVFT
jgi:aldehyde:ferredoxin oxidoreductase